MATKPPFDPETLPFLKNFPVGGPDVSTPSGLAARREFSNMDSALVLGDRPIEHIERTIPGPAGPITISILKPKSLTSTQKAPGMLFIHGGGMIMGNRFLALSAIVDVILLYSAVVVTVEYRLAPEHPAPAALEDSYAALRWFSENSADLGVDPEKLILAGPSAGGGIAAGVALMNRDRGGPKLLGQFLACPMIDDRAQTLSNAQYYTEGLWTGESNKIGWDYYLGPGHEEKEDISIYAAPSRAIDLKGMPPTYLDVGSAEPFRDEVVAFAGKLWEAGVAAELHVWAGGYHGFQMLAYDAKVSVASREAIASWFARLLKPS